MSGGDSITSLDFVSVPARDARPRRQHASGSAQPAFGAQLASFYPYSRESIDPQPRAAAAADARQRSGMVADTASMRRRRHARED